MAGDLIRETRRALLTLLKADEGVCGIVTPASVYPATVPPNPTWPFIRVDGGSSLPLDGPCHAGADVTHLVHGFARDRMSDATLVEMAEDVAGRLGSALKLALHRKRIPVADGTARLTVGSVRLLQDPAEAGAYHVVLAVDARAIVT